jgi:hypothetical protein
MVRVMPQLETPLLYSACHQIQYNLEHFDLSVTRLDFVCVSLCNVFFCYLLCCFSLLLLSEVLQLTRIFRRILKLTN